MSDPIPPDRWQPGDPLSVPALQMQTLSMDALSPSQIYALMVSAIAPRPIALVSTVDEDDRPNLAPFSYFNGVGTTPASVMFSIVARDDGVPKDTLRNIEAVGSFVINGVSPWMLAPMHHTAARLPHGEDEAAYVGLETCASLRVRPPRVVGAPWQLECRLHGTLSVGEGPGSGTVVVGEILCAHVATELATDGLPDLDKTAPVARIGGAGYALAGETLRLPRTRYTPK